MGRRALGCILTLCVANGCHSCGSSTPPQPSSLASAPDLRTPVSVPVPEDPSKVAIVSGLAGLAEVRRHGATSWVALKVGDAVREGDETRTSPDGRLEFSIGAARLHVDESSQITFKILSAKAVRTAATGYVEAEAGSGSARIEIAAEGSDAVAASETGRMFLYADGRGLVRVASLEGTTTLTSGGERVSLHVGEAVRVTAGAKPGKPAKFSPKVLLSVTWPPNTPTNKRTIGLRGSVDAGSRVLVQNKPVEVGATGDFVAEVTLREGAQQITVSVADLIGRRKSDSRWVTMDPSAPDIEGEVRYRQSRPPGDPKVPNIEGEVRYR